MDFQELVFSSTKSDILALKRGHGRLKISGCPVWGNHEEVRRIL
jgi:hypothetical protein